MAIAQPTIRRLKASSYEWLYITAFVAPATGESHWYVGNGVSKPLFERLLALFDPMMRQALRMAALSAEAKVDHLVAAGRRHLTSL